MKKQSIAILSLITATGFFLAFGSCKAPLLSQGSLSGATLSLSFSGGMANLNGAAPSGSGSARWLNPQTQYARAVLLDSVGNTVASGQGRLVSSNGNQIFQLMGVKPGNELRLMVDLFQDSTMNVQLGSATINNLSIKAGPNPPIAISVVPKFKSGISISDLSSGITINSGLLDVYALNINAANAVGFAECLEASDGAGAYPIITVLDSTGKIIGQCADGYLGNRVAFWVNSTGNNDTYYIVVNAINISNTSSLMLKEAVSALPVISASQNGVSWGKPYGSAVDDAVTYQVLIGSNGSKNINDATVFKDYDSSMVAKFSMGANQSVWVKYRVNGVLMGLLNCAIGYR